MGAPLESGRLIAGRYRLVTALGSGGMGTVWLGQDELLDRQVAVKEVSPPSEMGEAERGILRERTMREARTAARLAHPNVVTIYDVVEDGGRPWIVMALIHARSLRDIVLEDGPLTPQQAAQVALQVLAALAAAHALGIMHRDVKPGNVLIDDAGRAVLADFGIARADDSPTLTSSGMLVGSPSYIAPERARGERGGPASDLWSLGATLYAMVEGRPPYDRPGALATLTAVVNEDPDPPRRAGPLWPVISGLLSRDQAQRPGLAAAERMLRRIAEENPERNAEGNRAGHTVPLPIPAEWGAPGEAAAERPDPGGGLADAGPTRAFPLQAIEPAAAVTAADAAALAAVGNDAPAAVGNDASAAAENEEPERGGGPGESAPAPAMVAPSAAPSARASATLDTTSPVPVPVPANLASAYEPVLVSADELVQAPADEFVPVPVPVPVPAVPAPPGEPVPAPADVPVVAPPGEPVPASADVPVLVSADVPVLASADEPTLVDRVPAPAVPAPTWPVLTPAADSVLAGSVPAGPVLAGPVPAANSALAPDVPAPVRPGGPTLAPASPDERAARRQRTWVLTAAAALVVVIAGTVIGLQVTGGHAPTAPPSQSAGARAGSTAVASSGSRSTPAGSATPRPTAPSSAGGQAAVPAGYHRYQDPTGFSIAVPNGWNVSHQGHYVYVQPPSGGIFLLIDQSSDPKPDPLADWQQQEANRKGTYPGYHRIRLEAIRYPQAEKAADWEFTYYRQGVLTHVLNRNILANATHAYALYWSTPASEWQQSFRIFQVFASTFRPASP